jgi:predicted Zn-dependent protease
VDNKLAKGGALSQAARASGLGQAGADLIVDGFLAKPLDRGLEYEADRMGVIIAARAGYDPYGFISVLQMMESLAKDSPFFALLTKTHPSPSDRIVELEKIASTLDRYQGGDQGAVRFATALGRAAPGATPTARPAAPARRPTAAPAKAPTKVPAPATKTAPGK